MKNNILQEIESIAPLLTSIGNENAYKVPEGYFEGLSKYVLIENDISNEKSVPSGYFENLADQVISQAKIEHKTKVYSINYKKWVSVAAILLVGLFSYMSISMDSDADEASLFANIDVEYPLELLDEENIYLTDLYELVEEEFLEEMELLEPEGIVEDEYLEDVIYDLEADELDDLL